MQDEKLTAENFESELDRLFAEYYKQFGDPELFINPHELQAIIDKLSDNKFSNGWYCGKNYTVAQLRQDLEGLLKHES